MSRLSRDMTKQAAQSPWQALGNAISSRETPYNFARASIMR